MEDTIAMEQALYLVGVPDVLQALESEKSGRNIVQDLSLYHLAMPKQRRIKGTSIEVQQALDSELVGCILRKFKGGISQFVADYAQNPDIIKDIYEQARQRQEGIEKGFEHLVTGSPIGADLVMRLLNEPSIEARRNGKSKVIDTETFKEMLQREAVLHFHEKYNGNHGALTKRVSEAMSEGNSYEDALDQETDTITKRALAKIPSRIVTD